jgi:hypothetical protein
MFLRQPADMACHVPTIIVFGHQVKSAIPLLFGVSMVAERFQEC